MALYRGKGGAVFEITPPDPGTNVREIFDAKIESGELTLVEPEKPARSGKPAQAKPE